MPIKCIISSIVNGKIKSICIRLKIQKQKTTTKYELAHKLCVCMRFEISATVQKTCTTTRGNGFYCIPNRMVDLFGTEKTKNS